MNEWISEWTKGVFQLKDPLDFILDTMENIV